MILGKKELSDFFDKQFLYYNLLINIKYIFSNEAHYEKNYRIFSYYTLIMVNFNAIANAQAVIWEYKAYPYFTSPAIGRDGTIYITGSIPVDDYLFAVNPDATLKWKYKIDSLNGIICSSPSIGPDGSIYFGTKKGYYAHLYSIKSDGTLNWSFEIGEDIISSLAISKDGTIYAISDDKYLYSLNPNGTLKWKVQTNSGPRSKLKMIFFIYLWQTLAHFPVAVPVELVNII